MRFVENGRNPWCAYLSLLSFVTIRLIYLTYLTLSRTGKVADPTIAFLFLFPVFYSQILHHEKSKLIIIIIIIIIIIFFYRSNY